MLPEGGIGGSTIREQGVIWRRFAAILSALSLTVLALPAPATAASIPPPPVTVPSFTIMTVDGVHGPARHPLAKRRVASTIKMLNALVVRDNAKLTDVVVVSKKAAAIDNGAVGVWAGERLSVKQLLNMMLIASANDAAEALAIHIAGSEPKYVAMMNAKAKQLGLKNTHAADPHGLGKKETSTAEDLSVLARHILADPVLAKIVRTKSVTVPRPHHKSATYSSTDLLLGHYKGIEGVKTGYTDPAGYCFVGAAKRGGVELLGVVLGADSLSGRFSQMRKLLDWGFAHFHSRLLVSKAATLSLAPAGSADATVVARAERNLRYTLYDGASVVTTAVVLAGPVQLPVVAGSRLGTITVAQGSTVLTSVPLVAAVSVMRPAPKAVPETPTVVGRASKPRPVGGLSASAAAAWGGVVAVVARLLGHPATAVSSASRN